MHLSSLHPFHSSEFIIKQQSNHTAPQKSSSSYTWMPKWIQLKHYFPCRVILNLHTQPPACHTPALHRALLSSAQLCTNPVVIPLIPSPAVTPRWPQWHTPDSCYCLTCAFLTNSQKVTEARRQEKRKPTSWKKEFGFVFFFTLKRLNFGGICTPCTNHLIN